jgi:hypothetical protein
MAWLIWLVGVPWADVWFVEPCDRRSFALPYNATGMRKSAAARSRGRARRAQASARPAPTGFGPGDSSSTSSSGSSPPVAPCDPASSAAAVPADGPATAGPAAALAVSRKRSRTGGKSRLFMPASSHDHFLNDKQLLDERDVPEVEPFTVVGPARGSFDQGDPFTTNMHVGNLVRIPAEPYPLPTSPSIAFCLDISQSRQDSNRELTCETCT